MKKILIPTDISIKSLNVVHAAVEHFQEPVEIVLFHSVSVANGISDLLFANKREIRSYITQEYSDACQILKNKYSSHIKRLQTVFFYGSTLNVFNDFLEQQNADCIIINEQHDYQETYKFSINPMKLIKKSKCKILSLNVEKASGAKVTETSTISELLLSTY